MTGAPERTHSTHSDTNSNATISNGDKNTNGNCGSGSGSGNVFHVEVFAARKERAACGGPTDAGMGTEPNGRAAMAPEPGPAGTGTEPNGAAPSFSGADFPRLRSQATEKMLRAQREKKAMEKYCQEHGQEDIQAI